MTSSSRCSQSLKKNGISTLFLSIVVILMVQVVSYFHNSLLTPVDSLYKPDGTSQFSERAVMRHVKELSENIGYRILGTIEQDRARQYIMDEVLATQKNLQNSPYSNTHEIEVFYESGDGAHLFDFMNKYVIKKYHGLKNIAVRLSNGTDACKEEAILINAHVDSTLPSPGATDDALAVGILLENLRVLSSQPIPLTHSIIFLFNDAEESLQDASHLFITQSSLKDTVKCVVNLEACGTTGAEILFQATSNEMIKAYSHVPRPFGTVLADDVFRTGIIISDTDFRQFVQYGNLTGLDMAVVQNSYLYHTKKDLAPYITPGTAQQFGENIMAILRYLTSPEADMKNMGESNTVYFSILNRFFFMYSDVTARILNTAVGGLGIYLSIKGSESIIVPFLFQLFTLFCAFLFPNIWAFVFGNVLDRGMSWFRNESWPLFIYLPVIIASIIFSSWINKKSEYQTFKATVLLYSLITLVPLHSAYLFTIIDSFMILALLINDWVLAKQKTVHLLSYVIGSIGSLTAGLEASTTMLDIFVPLTGRIGIEKVADHIISCICVCSVYISFPLFSAWIQRLRSPRFLKLGFLLSILIAGISSYVLGGQETFYDALHPRRVFIQHMENITSNEFSLHVATADSAPGFEKLVYDVASKVSEEPVVQTEIDDWNSDWDTVYPFSQFLGSYRIPLNEKSNFEYKPRLSFSDKVIENGIANVTVTVDYPGLIWTVISFDANVISWSLPEVPAHVRRHHIREVSAYGINSYSFNMSYIDEPIFFDFVGLDAIGHYPSKFVEGQNRPSMRMCSSLNDDYLPDWTDALCIGVVSASFKLD
ncbi:peptidase [Schizosaccharomyces cryophilus OY26]|uniref:Peptide hydrolase n=1 Tax=Schizosaccharomyces cryophilus (strain OY26 / ATCC MYA-4695 / CBS 11777 / NBRC 106824 / NRRL Y48691) TaxID=653667 RepID=S9VUE4_SCHCR|nr:peptidase [Schizosaccharomyces cryophilus OY26]EPY49730.1 peptidase [Schizosaccharomyces cryophilus OY26]